MGKCMFFLKECLPPVKGFRFRRREKPGWYFHLSIGRTVLEQAIAIYRFCPGYSNLFFCTNSYSY